jgi:hypothetical protein
VDNSVARASLQDAWNELQNLQGVAPTVVKSAQALSGLLETLASVIESVDANSTVVDVFPGLLHSGGPDGPLGDGATTKLKSLGPSGSGIYALLGSRTVVIVAEPGIPFVVPATRIRSRNAVSAKALFMKVPTLELVYEEGGEVACLRFSFDDLPEDLALAVIKAQG